MIYHVLTPFSRWHNLIELGFCLKHQGVQWHLLLDAGCKTTQNFGKWVHQHEFPRPTEKFFIGHWMVNQFLDKVGVVDNDRYIVLTDDDMTEPEFFKKLDPFKEDVLVVSMQRSNKPSGTNPWHPYGTLMAAPENIKVGHVGFEQILPKGKILKQYRCKSNYTADGELIIQMFKDHPGKFRFVPTAYVHFDRLPPGKFKCKRWCQ